MIYIKIKKNDNGAGIQLNICHIFNYSNKYELNISDFTYQIKIVPYMLIKILGKTFFMLY